LASLPSSETEGDSATDSAIDKGTVLNITAVRKRGPPIQSSQLKFKWRLHNLRNFYFAKKYSCYNNWHPIT